MINNNLYILAFILAYIFSIILGKIIIRILEKLNARQSVSKFLNQRHLNKDKTPTMGGLIFIISFFLVLIIYITYFNFHISNNILLIIFTFISYALLGFIDDYLKVVKHNNKGISIKMKLLCEIIIAIFFFFIYLLMGNSTVINFFNYSIDLHFMYGFLILLMLIGTTNATNITDGLDGLLAGLMIISLLTVCIISYSSQNIVSHNEIFLLSIILIGALLGFLVYNFHPAKVFMGDLGSLSLGAFLASTFIVLKCELLLIIVGMVYIMETLSSFFQIYFIRHYNKKILLKSPLHHHFEEKGYKEKNIVWIFYLWGISCLIIGLILFFK